MKSYFHSIFTQPAEAPPASRPTGEMRFDCPLARTCDPLRVLRMEKKLRDILAYLDAWNKGIFTVKAYSDEYDILNHRYDHRTAIGGLAVLAHEALGEPLDQLTTWEDQYPIIIEEGVTKK